MDKKLKYSQPLAVMWDAYKKNTDWQNANQCFFCVNLLIF